MYEPYCNCCHYENQSIYMENSYQASYMDFNLDPISTLSSSSSISNDSKKKSTTRRSKHIPHHLRPQYIVERRNRRERLRVQDVNQAFYMLQQLLPVDSNSTTITTHNNDNNKEQLNMTQNSSRISKVRTLRKAVDYIEALQKMLNDNN
ncbi:unnamed protein product [Rotaria sp. Silwood2]|nr:unnamed protein product [Rotaria sp. Silwood2]CAF2941898.1 unnamed protein product [Rotaria sp. Silwood2]CAF3222512.1 unnamed protein product [Rotaria sp. Silwood2]CAF3288965.1 unnamed protein product [Rotaria sp. Silwood2]CAF4182270.1 unnamed protein product [Rotaria sp. Silwood2]